MSLETSSSNFKDPPALNEIDGKPDESENVLKKREQIFDKNSIPILETRGLCYRYPHLDSNALDKVNLKIFKGERVAVLGANGAGKSTLFKHFNGILHPLSGEIFVKGEKITKKNVRACRETVGIVFQNPDDQVLAPSVEEDIAFGPINMGLSRKEVEIRVKEALEMVGLKGFEERAPHHLSGGQKKLVAIAGILAMRPEVIVLDEPTAGLDPLSSARILELIMKMNRELGITLLLSTDGHDGHQFFLDDRYHVAGGHVLHGEDEQDNAAGDGERPDGYVHRPEDKLAEEEEYQANDGGSENGNVDQALSCLLAFHRFAGR